MDVLQLLAEEQWPLLRDLYKRDWPTYAQCYYWINNAMKWKKKDPEYPFNIYCPNGKHDSGVFVGTSTACLNIIVLIAFEESKDLLRRSLTESKVINWNEPILFAAIHQYCIDLLLNVLNEIKKSKNFEIHVDVTEYHFKSKEECAKFEINVPEECEFRHLDMSHIPLVHSLWPHRSLKYPEKSTKYLQQFIKFNRGVGLFLKSDNSLVSWILHTDLGALGMLQTVEEHKRKGYGKIVVKQMSKELATEENLDSVAFIIDTNAASQKLFQSLNYKRYTTATFVSTEPIAK